MFFKGLKLIQIDLWVNENSEKCLLLLILPSYKYVTSIFKRILLKAAETLILCSTT